MSRFWPGPLASVVGLSPPGALSRFVVLSDRPVRPWTRWDFGCLSLFRVTDIDEWSGAPGQLARVRRVVGGTRIYVEFPNASLAWVGTPEPVAFQDGQIVLLFPDRVEPAPPELWREDPMVSVVRIKNSETTVVEYAGQIRSIPTNDVEYEVGNTVEFLPSGVTKVLDSTPLSILELPEIGDKAISEVISPK